MSRSVVVTAGQAERNEQILKRHSEEPQGPDVSSVAGDDGP